MRKLFLSLVLAGSLAACAMFSAPAPAETARDALAAARIACDVYDKAPAKDHRPEADKACAAVRGACE